MGWTANTREDHLLLAYWRLLGKTGAVLTEVGLAGKHPTSPWPDDSTQRRVDAVRLLTPHKPGIFSRKGSTRILSELPPKSRVELIEVKSGLSEQVIGQCLVARALFTRQHPHLVVDRTVAVCKVADPALRTLCAHPDINLHVEVIPNRDAPGKVSTSRRRYLFNDVWFPAIAPWRTIVGGHFITRIPLGGPMFHDGSATTFVNLVRVPAAIPPHEAIETAEGFDTAKRFDSREQLLITVGTQPVDVIEYRPRLVRGVVGRLIAHANLLEQRYGLHVARRIVVVQDTDAALADACQQLAIEVVPLDSHAVRIP